jgi:hypothetical protein
MPWLDSAWLYRKKITVQAGQVSGGPHTNFPFLYSSDDADVNAHARPDGGDLRFTLEDGTTLLDRELIRFYQAPPFPASQQIAHVRVPSLSAGQELYVYFGNPAATEPGTRGAVWPGHSLVIHGELDGGQFYDSSPNAHAVTNHGCIEGTGKIGSGIQCLRADSDYLELPDTPTLRPVRVTMSCWAKVIAIGLGEQHRPVSMPYDDGAPWDNPFNAYSVMFSRDAGGGIQIIGSGNVAGVYKQENSNIGDEVANTFYHLAQTFDGNNFRLYRDAVEVANSPAAGVGNIGYNGSPVLTIGQRSEHSPGQYFDGVVEEVKVIDEALSLAWITTEYNNENDPASFFTLGPLENAPSGGDGTEGGRGGGGSTGVTSYPVAGRHGRLFRRTRIPSR